jgi:ATP-dependent helicase/nuclease subunit A
MLADQIAVKDLVALCEVIALPENDLALASVLKSPLFALDDEALVDLAAERSGSLWASLIEAGQSGSRFAEAAQTLRGWRGQADYVPPYELLSRILDADDGRFRRRMLSRLGAEAADAIDELVSLALAFDAAEPPSLQGFLTWLSAAPREIKRDMEQGRDEVRVMTVHGAKGLEAPIVILPDTCSAPGNVRGSGLLPLPDSEPVGGAPLQIWAVKGSSAAPAVEAARTARADADRTERNRLLYVAMTRPRDRLYVAGWRGDRKLAEDCWYRLMEDGLADRLAEVVAEDGSRVRRIVSDQSAPPETKAGTGEAARAAAAPPDWARTRVPAPPRLVIPIAPSRLAPPDTDDLGDPVTGPASADGAPRQPEPRPFATGRSALRRGLLTHALLQHLPAVAEPRRRDAGIAFLKARAPDLPVALGRAILDETLAVLDHPALAAVFARDSRAEVPVVAELVRPGGRGAPVRINGQIDRLAVRDGRVMFVDYKTNRPPPRDVADVPEAYLLQLAAYRIALAAVYGGRPIDAALLWTDGAIYMPVPAAVLDAAEVRVWRLEGGVSAAR